jgi:ElaB/YqjD/DUF883 family membrane-anchored ribosome-binding protein
MTHVKENAMNAKSIFKDAEAVRDDLAEKASGLVARGEKAIHNAENKAGEVSDAALEEISSLIAMLNDKIKAIGVNTELLADTAKEKAVSLEKSIVAELTERPLRSLALAALAGLALGILTRK